MHACNTYRNMTRGTSDVQESSGAQENGSLPASCGATRAQALAELLLDGWTCCLPRMARHQPRAVLPRSSHVYPCAPLPAQRLPLLLE